MVKILWLWATDQFFGYTFINISFSFIISFGGVLTGGDDSTWSQVFHQIINTEIMLLSKHFCLRPFFPKGSFYLLFACSVAPWVGMKENVSNFRSADRWEMHFPWSFRGILEFYGEFWRKFDQKDTYACL